MNFLRKRKFTNIQRKSKSETAMKITKAIEGLRELHEEGEITIINN